MRRAFEHPLAPVLGCALVCVVYLLARPATADMAAHSYRAWLFQHEGLTVWNAQWYGGHHVLGYSLLFAPLAAAIGPAYVGVLSAVAAVALFGPFARAAAPSPTAGAAAAWLLTAGVLSNVLIGRMPFLLGIALTVAAWAAGWSERRVLSGFLALRDAGLAGRGRVPDARCGGEADRRRSGGAQAGPLARAAVPGR